MGAGVHFRQALPPAKWPAMTVFLASLACRRQCGRLSIGRFLRQYRAMSEKAQPAGGGEDD